MKNKYFLLIGISILLCSCVHADLTQYESIDKAQKSITVPMGGGFVAKIKDVFRKNGWNLFVDQGPEVTSGELGQQTHLETYKTFRTRYRLLLSHTKIDMCLGHLDPEYRYNLSMIDNESGQEVMVMGGNACQSQIVTKINKFLESKDM